MVMSIAYRSAFSILSRAFSVASKMDSDWTFDNCSWRMEVDDAALKDVCTGSDWTREEDKAFENALATYYNDTDMWDKIVSAVPGKTIEDLKLHYEALRGDVEAIESGKVPLPDYPIKGNVLKEKKKSEQAQRGAPWTEEEHRQFLYGLQRFGRGNWKSISRYSVRTKSNSQVASHAQKYFKRLSSAKEGKRLSINDITTVNPDKLLAFEKATTSCMPGRCNEESTSIEKQQQPECTTEASIEAENQLLPGYSNEASGSAPGKKRRRPKGARTAKKALTYNENQLLPGFPEKAPTDTGNRLLLGSKKPRMGAGKLLPPPSLFGGVSDNSSFPGKAIGTDIMSRPVETTTSLGNQLLLGCPMEASIDLGKLPLVGYADGNQLLPPLSFDGSSFSGQVVGGPSFSAAMLQVCDVSSPPFAMEPVRELGVPAGSVEMSGHPTPWDGLTGFNSSDAVMRDADVTVDGQFDIGSSTEIMDLDLSLFPHFLD